MNENHLAMNERLLQIEGELIELFEVEALFGVSHALDWLTFYGHLNNENQMMLELSKLVAKLEQQTTQVPGELFGELEIKISSQAKRVLSFLLQWVSTDPQFESIRSNVQYLHLIKRLENLNHLDS